MGSKSSGSAHTPVEAKDSLKSTQFVRILDLLGEGSLSGWGNGGDSDDAMLKSTYFNDTPVLSETGKANFKGAKVAYLLGSEDQGYLPNFDTTENTVAVGTEVKRATPIVRTVTDSQLDRIIVTLRTGQMVEVNDQGDQNKTSVYLVVELMKDGATFSSRNVHIEGKTSDHFFRDVEFENLPEAPFQIRVRRVTRNSTSSKLQNQTYFASYVEIINAKLSYPHSAVVGVEFDSELFGSSIPTRNYLVKGLQIKVPSNYDPEARTYTGFWDGTFKVAFSNNPAWVFYDLVTSRRYGLGRKISPNQVDKWGLYSVAQYCDQLVDNGQGAMEPRFTCNAYLTEMRQAYEVLQDLVSCFRGMYVWDGQNVSVTIDRKSDPVAMYTNSNVMDGIFSYSSSPLNTIATAVQVQYVDAEDGYRTKTEYVSDDLAVRRYGLNVKRITSFGCTSRSQAIRTGKWLLETSRLERQTVTFSVGRAGLKHLPYDIIQVVDNDYAGVDMAGRIETVNQNLVTLDRPVSDLTGTEFSYLNTLGKLVTSEIVKQVSPTVLQLVDVIVPHVTATFVIRSKGLGKRFFRALTISEDQDNGSYTINAVEHIPEKESVVDNGVEFEPAPNTIYDRLPILTGTQVEQGSDGVTIVWSGNGQTAGVTYQVKVYRDNLLMDTYNDLVSPNIKLSNLRPGSYKLEIRARNKNGQWSEPGIREFTIDYSIYNFKATPKLWAVQLDWDLPNLSNSGLKTEVWVSSGSDFLTSTKVADVASPTNTLTHDGLKLEDKYYYWVRLSDSSGFSGEPVGPIEGSPSTDPSAIVEYIEGQITGSALHQDLVDQWQGSIDSAVYAETQARIAAVQAQAGALQAEAQTRAANDLAEATARANALNAEATARTSEVQQAAQQSADNLLATATQIGTRITAVETVNANQATQISTVTAAQGTTASGLQTEITARIAGDTAEATARQTLAARVDDNQALIYSLQTTVADNKSAAATQITALKTTFGQGQNLIAGGNFGDVAMWRSHYGPVANIARHFVSDASDAPSSPEAFKMDFADVYKDANGKGLCYNFSNTAVTVVSGRKYRFRLWVSLTGTNGSCGFNYYQLTKAAYVSKPVVMMVGVKQYYELILDGADFADASINPGFYVNHLSTAGVAVVDDFRFEDVTEILKTNADLSLVSANLTSFQSAQSKIDTAQTTDIKTALSQASNNASSITSIQTTLTTNTTAIAEVDSRLTAKIDNLNADMMDINQLTNARINENTGAVTTAAGHRLTHFMSVYDAVPYIFRTTGTNANVRFVWFNEAKAYISGVLTASITGSKTFTAPANARYLRVSYGYSASAKVSITEVAAAAAAAVSADLESFKSAQATKDAAQTSEIDSAKSRLGTAEANITSIQSTKANKSEVVSLAQTGLQSVWKGDINAAVTPVTNRIDTAESNIMSLQTAVSNNESTTATQISNLNSLILSADYKDTRGVDNPPSWYVTNFPRKTSKEFKNSADIGVGLASNFVTLITDNPQTNWQHIVQTAYPRGMSKTYIRRPTTESAWGAWEEQETSAGAQAKADAAKAAVTADLNSFKSTQASVDSAQTFEIDAAKSRLGTAEASITSIQSTKADKSEVAALAETTLKSKWEAADAAVVGPVATRVTSAESSITALQSTVTTQNSSIASMNTTLSAKIEGINVTPGLVAGGDFKSPLLWSNHFSEDITNRFVSSIGGNPPSQFAYRGGIGTNYIYSTSDVVFEAGHTYRFSAWFYNAAGNGGFGFNVKHTGKSTSYQSFTVEAVSSATWQRKEVIVKADQINDFRGRPGFFANHSSTTGYALVTGYSFEDITFENKVQSMYSLKVEAFGSRKAVAGIAIGADGETGDAEVLILGNKFMIADPNDGSIKPMLSLANVGGVNQLALNGNLVADGTILGRHIKANETISAPVISGGTISGTTINGTIVNGGTIKGGEISGSTINVNDNFLVDSSGNMTAKSGTFDGTVTADSLDTAFAQRVVVELGVWTNLIGPSRYNRNLVFDYFKILLQRTNNASDLWRYCINLKIYIRSPSGVETLVRNLGMGKSGGSEVFERDADSFPASIARDFNQIGIAIPKEGCSVRLTVTAGTRRTNGDGGFLTNKNLFMLDNDNYYVGNAGFSNSAPSRTSASISRHLLMATLYRS